MTVVFCALAFGGAVRWAVVASTAAAIATAIPYVTSRRSAEELSPLLILIGIAIALTALQLVPLPVALADILAGSKVELVTDHARAWGEEAPAFIAASYDPSATLVELAKLCGYAALAFATLRLASHRRGRNALAMVVVGAAVAVAVVAIIHEVIGARSIYGLFESPVKPQLVSPIINANHLASLMAMAAAVALGLAVSSVGMQRAVWIAAALTCAGVTLLSSSRGGAIGLGIGLIVTTVIMLLQRRANADGRDRLPKHTWIAGAVIAGCVVVWLVILTASQVFDELAATRAHELYTSGSKYQVWGRAVEMLQDNLWLGTGRGAFEQAFTRWSQVGVTTYSHAENSYLQPVVDWGVPGVLAILLAGIAVLRAALPRWRHSPLEAGVLGALASLAVHELADFSLELPIVAMVAIVLLAILLPPALNTTTKDVPVPPLSIRTRWQRSALLAGSAIVCLMSATSLGQSARVAAGDVTGPPTQMLARAKVASARHPADYLLLGRGAQALMTLGDPRAVAVITRALFLHPHHAGLHRLAAVMLARSQNPMQAQAEFALAVHFAPSSDLHATIQEVVSTFLLPEQAARALPIDLTDAPRIVADLTAHHHDLVNLEYTRRLAMLHPDEALAQLLCARAAITTNQGQLALAMSREAYRLKPDADSVSTFAQSLSLLGDVPNAIATLRTALSSGNVGTAADRSTLLVTIVDLELARGALGAAATTLDELALLAADVKGRIAVHARRAQLHDRRGEANQAVWEREQAAKLARGERL